MVYSSNIDIYHICDMVDEGNIDGVKSTLASHNHLLHEVRRGRSLLHIAADAGNIELCHFFLSKGISIDVLDDHLMTPLANTAVKGHFYVAEFLLKRGAAVDGDPRGKTSPLILASQEGHLNIVELLLNHGADINRLQINLNCTALDLSISYNREYVVDFLRNQGAKTSLEKINIGTEVGGGIIEHIYNNVGPILSDEYFLKKVTLKTALVGKGNSHKLLFTFGNFKSHLKQEFLLCLPYDWPLNREIFNGDYKESFPLKFLSSVSNCNLDTSLFSEGYIFDKKDKQWCELAWPEDIDGLITVDYSFNHKEKESTVDGNFVSLLLLVPIKYPKSGQPKDEKLNEWVTRRRSASWKSVSFKKEWLQI